MTQRYLGITALSALLTLTAITGGRTDDATLLPNAIQYFMDANGKPLANGKVFMYTPSTTTPKTTWTTASKAVAQPQPFIPLGIAGKPASPIYGDGSYRQLVQDQFGNTIWDFNTASTGGSGGVTPTPTVGDGNIVGTILAWSGLVAPPNYIFAYGQAISRATYPLFTSTVTIVSTMICTSGLNVLSGIGDTQNIRIGSPVEASCIPPGTTVTAVAATSVTISASASISTAVTGTFFPYGNGNGSTTLNVPDLRGLTLVGRQNMGGTGRTGPTPLPPFYWNGPSGTSANSLGALGGSSNQALGTPNLPPYLPTGTITNGAITSTFTGAASQQALGPGGGSEGFTTGALGHSLPAGTVVSSQATSTFTGVQQGGTSTPFATVQPSITMNYVIKVLPDVSTAVASGVASIGGMTGVIACGTGVICGSNTISLTGSPIPAAFVTFQQTGTGSVILTEDDLLRTRYYTPEMFGATCGLGGNAVANQAALQAAINQVALTGGKLSPSNCLYNYTGSLSIPAQGVVIEGQGSTTGGNTEFYWTPTVAGQCAINVGSSGITSGVVLKNFALRSPDTTTYKNGICGTDTSKLKLQDIEIWGWNGGASAAITGAVSSGGANEIRLTVAGASTNFSDGWAVAVAGVGGTVEANSAWPIKVISGTQIDLKGSTFTNAYTSGGTITLVSTGIKMMGRELFEFNNVNIAADLPQRVSVNPHYATNSLDQSAFTNMTLASVGAGGAALTLAATTCNLLIDDGVVMTNDNWLGTQSWGGGKSGVCWRDKSAPAINEQISWDNVRAEQKAISGGWFFDLQPSTTTYSIHINNLTGSDRNGVRARNIANLQLDNPHFIGGAGQTCLDLDSTVQSTQVNGAVSLAGTTNTLAGQTLWYASPNQTGGCVAPFAHYENSASGSNQQGTTTFGVTGTSSGSILFKGLTSGSATISAQAAQGTPNLAIPTGSGTFAASGTAPLVLDAVTGNIACPTCVTSSGGSPGTLTFGTHLISGGTSYNGAANVTITSDATSTNTVSTIMARDGSGQVAATTFTGALAGNATTATSATTATTATNATNGATVATSTNASFFPLFAASSTNSNQPFNLDTTLTYNPSTDTLTATNFAGNATTSTSATSATNATNTAITDDTTTNATMYPTWVTANTGNLPQKTSSTKLSFNPSTGALSATSFSGAGTGLTGVPTTALTGALQAAQEPAHTGDVTNTAGSLALSIAANAVTLAKLATQATNTVLGNATSGSAVPTALTMTSCSTAGSAVKWTTNTGFGCNTAIDAATLGGATFAAPGAIGGGTPSTGAFSTITASSMGTFGTNAVSGDIIANGPNSGTGAGSQFITQLAGTANIGMGNLSRLITGGAFDATPAIYGGSGIGVYIGGTTKSISLNAANTATTSTSTGSLVIGGTGGLAIGGTLAATLASDAATVDNTVCISSAGVFLKGSGTLGVCLGTSSAKFKHDIAPMGAGLAEIVRLAPKNFFYNNGYGDDGKRQQYGFIAEDVVKVLPGVTAPDKDGKPQSVDMLAMVPVLVNAIKQLKADNDNLRMDVQALQAKSAGKPAKQ